MQIFEHVIDQAMRDILPALSRYSHSFYLGGGTGLALQTGHRKSEDFDFFSINPFDENRLALDISGANVIQQYPVPLINEPFLWEGIKIATVPDLIGEKFKTIAQRGAKKDFCDLYAIFNSGISIQQGCQYFKKRFKNTGIQFYSILKGLTYFKDAESHPDPIWLQTDFSNDWEDVKSFFIKNIKEFGKELIS